jgi:hypothetical protein
MIEVEVGDTIVEFPDGTSQEVMTAALQKQFGGQRPEPQGMLAKAVEPITSYPATYDKMQRDARGQIVRGGDQIAEGGAANIAYGAGNIALGSLGYLTSPINAALRTVVGKPLEESLGVPKEYSEFAASMAIPGMGLTKVTPKNIPVAPKPLAPGQEVAQAAERLSATGAPVTVPRAVASDSVIVQRAGATARNIPFAGDPVVKATERSLGQLGGKADEVAAAYGGASVPSAGGTASRSITNWIGPESKARVTELYDKVDNLVDPAVSTELTASKQTIANIVGRRANMGDETAGKAADFVGASILNKPGGLNYQGVKDLRTRVGEMLDQGILPEGWSGAELKQLYGSLTDDLGNAVRNAGGAKASAAFERANRYNRLVNDRREALTKIVGANGDAPAETVFARLAAMASSSSRADISRLAQARKAMDPDEWNEVSSAVVAGLGRDTQGGFSPQRFVTAWAKLSDGGKSLLFRSGGKSSLANHLDDISTISNRWKDLQKFANPSGTGQTVAGASIGAGLMAEPVTTITTVIGARAMAHVLSKPVTAAPVAQFARKYEIALRSPSPVTYAGLTVAARNLANNLSERLGTSVTGEDFLRAIQGPVPARSEQEQPQPVGVGN